MQSHSRVCTLHRVLPHTPQSSLLLEINRLALAIDWLTHVVAPRSWSEELALSMRARLRALVTRAEGESHDCIALAANYEALARACIGIARCADELLRVNTDPAICRFAERAAARAYELALVAEVLRSFAVKRIEVVS